MDDEVGVMKEPRNLALVSGVRGNGRSSKKEGSTIRAVALRLGISNKSEGDWRRCMDCGS